MKIAHISDLHLNTEYKTINNKKTYSALEYIIDSGFDHLIISGDITENGDKNSYELARKIFRKFNLLNNEKLTLVIGNHDIFGGVNYAKDIIDFPKRCRKTNYDDKIKEFESYFPETLKNTFQPSKDFMFPFSKEFDSFVLIGINTIAKYTFLKNPFASNGAISKTELQNIEEILNLKAFENKDKFIIGHHHFSKQVEHNIEGSMWKKIERQTMKLRDKKKIIKLFSKYNVKAVFHGHMHESNEYYRKGIRFMNAGGSVLGYENELKINYVKITPNKIELNIKSIPYTTKRLKSYTLSQKSKSKNHCCLPIFV